MDTITRFRLQVAIETVRRDCLILRSRLLRSRQAVARRHDPDQPRVPAGSPDGGRWTGAPGGAGNLAGAVIATCIPVGIARWRDQYGNPFWSATFDCLDGRSIRREGRGFGPPGLVRQRG